MKLFKRQQVCVAFSICNVNILSFSQIFSAQTNTSNGSTNEEPSPNAMKEMPFPTINNADPNMMYPDRPPVMSGPPHAYYNDPNMPPIGPPPSNAPPHRPDMLGGPPPDMMGGPPPPIPPNDHYHNHPPPNWGPPDMRHYHPPPPNFHPGYRDDNAWRPREPWRGHGHHIPGKNKVAIFIAFIFSYAKNLSVFRSLKNKSYVQCDTAI